MSNQDRPFHAALPSALATMMRAEPCAFHTYVDPAATERAAIEIKPGADADFAALKAQAQAEARQSHVATAHQAAAVLVAAIQRANKRADPLLSLLLLPLIGDAAKLETALGQIALALESRE